MTNRKLLLWLGELLAVIGLLILPLTLFLSGCKSSPSVPNLPENLDAAVSNAIAALQPDPAKPAPVPGTPPAPGGIQEDLALASIAKVLQGSADWLAWPVTVDLSARISGGKVLLEPAPAWPQVDDVCGSCWIIVKRDGRWVAACFDYIRAGQTFRKLPWAPGPDEDPVDWITLDPAEEAYFLLTGLCRDKRRNVHERGPIRRIQ